MTVDRVIVEITRIEAAHLAGLVTQFDELLDDTASGDPAVARLVPAVYLDDVDAEREFRRLTEDDLLDRRRVDAGIVLGSLRAAAAIPDDPADPALLESVALPLDAAQAQAWLRTLAAVRLVLAERLGIEGDDDHHEDDPRFGVYDWLGYRLHGLVTALEG